MKLEWIVIWIFVVSSIIAIPFWIRKPYTKDWLLVYFMQAFIAGWIDMFFIYFNVLEYPIRLLAEVVKISVMFDILVFPTICVFYCQTSDNKSWWNALLQALLYTAPGALLEFIFERKTDLIEFYNWNVAYSFISIVLVFLFVRFLLHIIRKVDVKKRGQE